jgi:predicted enzyme related to lactoylglutathione lyase
MNVRAVDFVMFPVSNLARAASFYHETLGLPQGIYSEEYQWAEFDCGNVTLGLKGNATVPARSPDSPRLALAVEDVSATCEDLKAHGIGIADGPNDWGVCWCAEIHDPDGNAILLHHRADGTWGLASHHQAATIGGQS